MSTYPRDFRFSFGGPITPAVKTLILLNMIALVLQLLIPSFTDSLSLQALKVLPWHFQIWRLFTYMFLHSGLGHLFWNMLLLFMFGCTIERVWGSSSFYRYFFLCGLGGALFSLIPFGPFWSVQIIGASGALYGILLAFGMMFPNREILVFLMFPVPARYLVSILGFAAFVSSISGAEGIAHIVHLGGFVSGFLLLRFIGVTRSSIFSQQASFRHSTRDFYRRWRMKRLRRKFDSYYDKHSDRDAGPMH